MAPVSEVTEVPSPTPPPVNPVAEAFGLPKKAEARMTTWHKMTEVQSSTHNAPTGTYLHEALRKSITHNDAEIQISSLSYHTYLRIIAL